MFGGLSAGGMVGLFGGLCLLVAGVDLLRGMMGGRWCVPVVGGGCSGVGPLCCCHGRCMLLLVPIVLIVRWWSGSVGSIVGEMVVVLRREVLPRWVLG